MTRACPSCAKPIDSDPRFSDWCPACEWNLGPEPALSRRQVRRRARERDRIERLYGRQVTRPAGRRRTAAWPAALLVATLVHLITLAVAAGSVVLLFSDVGAVKLLGVVGLGLTFLLRPRLGGRPGRAGRVDRAAAPQLYELADRIADELGTRRAAVIRVSTAYQARYARRGLRREVELTLGMPLWTVLTPAERVALLGHELGHGANGDQRRGFWLVLATETLEGWLRVLQPSQGDQLMAGLVQRRRGRATPLRGSGQKPLIDEATTVALQVIALPVRFLLGLLGRLTEGSTQQAEYLADDLAAQVGSSKAVASMLARLALADSATTRLRQQRAAGGHSTAAAGEALWSDLREYLDSVPPSELERRYRLSAREMTRIDASHPPTHLRIRLRVERPEQPAAVEPDSAQWAAIDAELAEYRSSAARSLVGC